jgi:hypothetical protein
VRCDRDVHERAREVRRYSRVETRHERAARGLSGKVTDLDFQRGNTARTRGRTCHHPPLSRYHRARCALRGTVKVQAESADAVSR